MLCVDDIDVDTVPSFVSADGEESPNNLIVVPADGESPDNLIDGDESRRNFCLPLPASTTGSRVPRSDVRVAAVAIKVELTPANDGAGIISGDEPIDDEIRFHTLAPVINLSALNAVGGMYTDEDPHEGTKEHETLPRPSDWWALSPEASRTSFNKILPQHCNDKLLYVTTLILILYL
ncbi:hypothetical protein MHU86_21488 [Fragilaria crotonensis]|nr:hypothetical protein MHU86_21488 [Fragilaria crotonensis]